MPAEQEVSYGGVVIRGSDVLVIVPRGRRRVLSLPKGGRDPGETPEETAAREVREETGITATVRERLGQVDYRYRRGGRRVAKTVHFYLCEFETGDTGETAVPGLYAAGNVTDPSQQVSQAAANGSRVGAMISFSLADDDIRAAARPSPGDPTVAPAAPDGP